MTTISLIDIVKEHLASDELQLPVFAPVAMEMREMLSREEVNIEAISEKVQRDQALTGQLLRAANSAFYGGLRQIGTIRESVMRLGTKEVMNLVVLSTQQRQYESKDKFLGPYMTKLWQHASCCAMGCQWLSKRLGHGALGQQAFMAGLLHDIGQLF